MLIYILPIDVNSFIYIFNSTDLLIYCSLIRDPVQISRDVISACFHSHCCCLMIPEFSLENKSLYIYLMLSLANIDQWTSYIGLYIYIYIKEMQFIMFAVYYISESLLLRHNLILYQR